jgi:trehalose 6-phosphate phosphatase
MNVPYVAGLLAERRAGLVLDHDAVLAAPGGAGGRALATDVGSVLGRLAERLAVVAVVGADPARHLAGAVGAPRLVYAGEYGAEWAGHPTAGAEPLPLAARLRLAAAGPVLAVGLAGVPGVRVERRGRSIRVRGWAALARTPERVARLQGWLRRLGLATLERGDALESRVDRRRGGARAIERIVADFGLDAVVYLGDARADPDSFGTLQRLRSGGLRAITVSVGTAPAPTGARDDADLHLPGPEAAAVVLARLAHHLRSGSPSPPDVAGIKPTLR